MRFAVQANAGDARQGAVQVAGHSLSVAQLAGSACPVTVTPDAATVQSGASDFAVDVTPEGGQPCPWTAASGSPFITIKEGATGSGAGRVVFAIAANSGDARVGTATVAGRTVTLLQDGFQPPVIPCEFTVTPGRLDVPAAGLGATVITITKTQGGTCPWVLRTGGTDFVTIVGPRNGEGSGTFTITVAPNSSTNSRGTQVDLTSNPNGPHLKVSQAGAAVPPPPPPPPPGPCAFTISPTAVTTPAAGGQVLITITRTQGVSCPWTAQPQASFLSLMTLGSGTDSGAVTIAVAANTGGPRAGTVLVAGHTMTVNQSGTTAAGTVAVLSIESDTGDLLGGGITRSYTLTASQFTLATDPGRSEVQFSMPPGGGDWWALTLRAPSGQTLAPGLYERAQQIARQLPGFPGLDFRGNHRACSNITGRFQIATATFAADNSLQRLHARFEQHCENWSVGVRGEIWIDAGGSTSVPAIPPLPRPSTPTSFLSFVSEPGDFIGGGATRSYTMSNMIFTGWLDTFRPHVAITLRPLGAGSEWWNIDFQAPSGQLVPGTYENATRFPFQNAGVPGLSFSGTGRGCNTLTGRFVVLEASFGPLGEVYRFHATFEQRCDGSTAALRGEIRIVADPWR